MEKFNDYLNDGNLIEEMTQNGWKRHVHATVATKRWPLGHSSD